jgi:hypothetical protein
MHLPKKVKRIIFINNQILVADKHGDIFNATVEEILKSGGE